MESTITRRSSDWLSEWMWKRCSVAKHPVWQIFPERCFQKDGVVKAIHNENEPAEDIVDLSFNIAPGEEVHHYTNGRDRLGQVILRGESLESCEKRLQGDFVENKH